MTAGLASVLGYFSANICCSEGTWGRLGVSGSVCWGLCTAWLRPRVHHCLF